MLRKFETQGCQWCGVKQIFSRIRGIVEQGLEHLLFIVLDHFFNKAVVNERIYSSSILFLVKLSAVSGFWHTLLIFTGDIAQ